MKSGWIDRYLPENAKSKGLFMGQNVQAMINKLLPLPDSAFCDYIIK